MIKLLLLLTLLNFTPMEEPEHTWVETDKYTYERQNDSKNIYANYSRYEVELLMALVEAEAGNQLTYGKQLVADVVLNRVDSDEFPNSIYEVIYQRLGDEYQFSVVPLGMLDEAFGNVSEDTRVAVMRELVSRSDEYVYFFRTKHFASFGVPMYQYGDHYFSGLGGEDE